MGDVVVGLTASGTSICVSMSGIFIPGPENGSDVFFLLDDQLLLLKSRNDPLATPEVLKMNFFQKGFFYIEGFHFYKVNNHFFAFS